MFLLFNWRIHGWPISSQKKYSILGPEGREGNRLPDAASPHTQRPDRPHEGPGLWQGLKFWGGGHVVMWWT